jgi:hypothetical protein
MIFTGYTSGSSGKNTHGALLLKLAVCVLNASLDTHPDDEDGDNDTESISCRYWFFWASENPFWATMTPWKMSFPLLWENVWTI